MVRCQENQLPLSEPVFHPWFWPHRTSHFWITLEDSFLFLTLNKVKWVLIKRPLNNFFRLWVHFTHMLHSFGFFHFHYLFGQPAIWFENRSVRFYLPFKLSISAGLQTDCCLWSRAGVRPSLASLLSCLCIHIHTNECVCVVWQCRFYPRPMIMTNDFRLLNLHTYILYVRVDVQIVEMVQWLWKCQVFKKPCLDVNQ